MKIENGVFSDIAMRWSSFTFPIKAGTPVSAAGVEANDATAVGIIPQDIAARPLIERAYILTAGVIDPAEVAASYGQALTDEAMSAMNTILFTGFSDEGGGGGESGLPEISTEPEAILEKQTLEFEDWGGTAYGSSVTDMPAPIIGEHYIITYDGVEYDCVAFHPSTPDPDEVLIGNENIWQGAPVGTGEPFVIDYYHGEGESGWDIMTYSTSATHEVGVSHLTQVPADGTALSVSDGEWKALGHVLPPVTGEVVIVDGTFEFESSPVMPPGVSAAEAPMLSQDIADGDDVTVTWDGVAYTVHVADFGTALACGNMSIIGAGDDTGEPFLCAFTPDVPVVSVITNASGEEHSLKISQIGPKQLYPDYSVPLIEKGEWAVGSNVITLDAGESTIVSNESQVSRNTFATLSASVDPADYGISLPSDVSLPVVAVKFADPVLETAFILGSSEYYNGTLTINLLEGSGTTFLAHSVVVRAVTLLFPQKYALSGR